MGQYYTSFLCPITKELAFSNTISTQELLNHIKMGDYITVNASDYDSGLKLMESAWIGNVYVNAVISHIHNNPMAVAWIGDYSNDVEFFGDVTEDGKISSGEVNFGSYSTQMTKDVFGKIFNVVINGEYSNKHNPKAATYQTLLTRETQAMYFVNHTQKLYIDIANYIEANIDVNLFCINPLPLLTACGNGLGGGDYHNVNQCYSMVGDWAFNVIEYRDTIPKGYEPVIVNFAE